ncbi:3-hydroxybutyrate oligomer hydrolase family protein [Dokdonella sp.]|uniref:3-hydroxybutyrate oligomer hydrolase family protein n=1 Tax=Dokdonella sp. TaxID=2291710 RepID=UPI001B010280|nr:3-hydroxybutyrate oligomer hydrolase family protein [Dokdonella sp.]MBO9661470.1 hydrogenase [Dokdonella sp.]
MTTIHRPLGDIRETAHRDGDDLLSAGLGSSGLRAKPPAFADAAAPTPHELRRRAIHANWNGIADLGPLGGYGTLYGGVPNVPGREYQAFAWIPGAHSPHRVLAQIPDAFDARARCLLIAPASGSRGVYGAIALAGAWGLPRGCAVVYTDKGAGTGYFDADSQTGVRLDGARARRGDAPLEFESATGHGVAIKHAHSGDHPEADWGRHVLQAAQFGLAMLDRAFPAAAPFTPSNTRVIAVGLSNGGGAVLQAAGLDQVGLLSGVVALEPNVHVDGHGRAAFDYVTEAALYLPCALLDVRFDAAPFARVPTLLPAWRARGARLREAGLVAGGDVAAQSASALERLFAAGWDEPTLATAASSTAFDLWRAVGATYTSAYLRAPADAMPCGFRFAAVDARGTAVAADAATRAAWWSDAAGIPPGNGVALLGGSDASDDPTWIGLDGLRALWRGDSAEALRLRASVAATAAAVPRADLPILIAQGEGDGLLPIMFSSAPYVQALAAAGRAPTYWRVPHAQHFDAFLALPGFGERHVPLLPYGYAALDALWAHLANGTALPPSRRFDTRPRGAGALERAMLGM